MSEVTRLFVYPTLKDADECMIAKWLKPDIAVGWNLNLFGPCYDVIVIMPFPPYPSYPKHLELTPKQELELHYFLLEHLPTRLKPNGRILDLNTLTGATDGQAEPDHSNREGNQVTDLRWLNRITQNAPEA